MKYGMRFITEDIYATYVNNEYRQVSNIRRTLVGN